MIGYLNCQCDLCGEMASILFSGPVDEVIHAGCPLGTAVIVGGTWRPMMQFPSTPKLDAWKAEQDAKRPKYCCSVNEAGHACNCSVTKGAAYRAELQKLREQNAALQLNEHDLEKENERLKAALSEGMTEERARDVLAMSNYAVIGDKQLCALESENRRLKMDLADVCGKESFRAAAHAYVSRELEFAKGEVARHDPRLAQTRWGIEKTRWGAIER